MFKNKPILIILTSGFFFLVGLSLTFLTGLFAFIATGESDPIAMIVATLVFLGFAILFFKTAMGILKKRNWARNLAIFLFGLYFLGTPLSFFNGTLFQESYNRAYMMGKLIGAIFAFTVSAIGLHAMVYNQSVKDYFDT